MKALPVILILIAAAVLFWVASNRPDSTGTGETSGAPAEAGQAPSGGAQESAAGVQPPRATPAGSVHGFVRNASGGAVSGIEVSLVDAAGAPRGPTRTAKDGSWSFDRVTPGSYQVVAKDPDSLYTLLTSPRIEHGASGSTQADLFADRGTGFIEGVMTSRSGAPLVAEPVMVQSVQQPDMKIRVLTGNKGNYRVGGLSPGSWTVQLTERGESHTVQIKKGGSASCDLSPVLPASLTVTLAAPADVALVGTESVKMVPHVSTVEAWAEVHAAELPAAGPERAEALRRVSQDLSREETVNEHGKVVFGQVFPGRYEVQALFSKGSSEQLGLDGSVNLRLEEGQPYEQVLATANLQRGSALHVPVLIKVILACIIGVMFLLPMILMPKPVMPNRPQGSSA